MSLKFLAVGLTLADAARPALRVRSSSSLEANALVVNQPESQLQASSGLSGLLASVDVPLLLYFAFWYLGNYYYTLSNKRALVAAGGKKGFPMTISTLQLGVGVLYALFAWFAPDLRSTPSVTMDDVIKMIPVGFCAAAAHSFSVFAQSAGAVSFAMIVKAAEPAFAAVIGTSCRQEALAGRGSAYPGHRRRVLAW